MSKVRWGLNNVYYALKTEEGYGNPKRVRGAVTLTAEPEGETNNFYADDGVYFQQTTNNGRSGTLTIAKAGQEFLTDLLGYEVDDNGVVVEMADVTSKEFALMYSVQSDDPDPTKYVMYDVKLTRSSQEHNTQEDNAEPETESFDFTAIPAEVIYAGTERKVVGAFIEKSETNAETYSKWFTAVYQPTKAAA